MSDVMTTRDISHHSNQLLKMLHHFYEHHLLTDFVFIVMPSKEEIPVHRVVISTFCRYFQDRLASGTLCESVYVLEDVDAGILSMLLEFMYTGYMSLSPTSVSDVMSLAIRLGAQTAVDFCQLYLNSQVDKKVKDESIQPTTINLNTKRYATRSTTNTLEKFDNMKITDGNSGGSSVSCKKGVQTGIEMQEDMEHGTKYSHVVNTQSHPLVRLRKRSQEVMEARFEMNLNYSSLVEYKQKHILLMSKLYHCRVCKKAFIYSSLRCLHEQLHGFVPFPLKLAHLLTYQAYGNVCHKLEDEANSVHYGQDGMHGDVSIARQQSLISSIHGYSASLPTEEVCDIGTGLKIQEAASALSLRGNKSDNVKLCKSMDKNNIVRSWPYKNRVVIYEVKSKHYHCELCEACFPFSTLLKVHHINHHGKWKCQCCKKHFRSAKSLALHQRIMSVKMQNVGRCASQRCGFCNQIFLYENNLHHHLETVKHFVQTARVLCCGNCQLTFRNTLNYCRHPCYALTYPLMRSRCASYDTERAVTKQIIQKLNQNQTDTRLQEDFNKYRCKLCAKTFALYYHGQMHVRTQHQQSALYKKIWKELMRKERVQCQESGCSYSSNAMLKLATHIKEQHPGVRHKCDKCQFTTPILQKLALHLCREHGLGKLCEICGKSFRKQLQLRIHRVSKHNLLDPMLKPIRCSISDCQYVAYHKSLIKQHMIKHSGDNNYPCPYCGRKLKRERYLTKHINKVHMGIRPFICDQCGANYGEESELKSHMARHEAVPRYNCEHCSYMTQDKGNLKSHMWSRHKLLLNKNQKLFSCDVCNYRCDRRTRFMDHLNTHKQVRQFHCKTCGHTFFTKSTLEGHLKVVHSDSKVQCTYCEYKTKNKYHLKNHIRVMHTHRHVKPYKCPYCDFRCASSGNCRKHVMNRHKGLPVTWLKVNDSEVVKAAPVVGMETQQKLVTWHPTSCNQSADIVVKAVQEERTASEAILNDNCQEEGSTIQPLVPQLQSSTVVSSAAVSSTPQYSCVLDTEQTKLGDGVIDQAVQIEESSKSLCLYMYLADQPVSSQSVTSHGGSFI